MTVQPGRSRWSGLDQNFQPIAGQLVSDTGNNNAFIGPGSDGQNPSVVQINHGGYLRREDDGPNSDYYRCYYDRVPEPLLCEKVAGCCVDGCCPKDVQWLGGIWVLIAVVIAIFVIGFAASVVCYSRSKAKSKKEKEAGYPSSYYAGSQHPYGSELGAGSKYGGAPY